MLHGITFSGRLTSRIEVPENLWVLLQCDGRDAVSRVRDISSGGLFIEIPQPRSVGAVAKLYFFVPEGEIKARAVVRHVEPDNGVGLKFTATGEADRQKLEALVTRLRSLSQSHS